MKRTGRTLSLTAMKKLRLGDLLIVLRIRGGFVEVARLPRRLSLKRVAAKYKKSGGREPLISPSPKLRLHAESPQATAKRSRG